jgi:photosystem II stability/assembly factor-like uncharacterized protein
MKNIILSLLILISVTLKAQFVQTSGPSGIVVNSLYKNNGIIFAGTKALGIYKSTNNGANWFTANTGVGYADIRGFAFYNNAFYAVAFGPDYGSRGIYKSTDNGISWSHISSMIGKSITSIAVSANYLIVSTPYPDGGLFRSSDEGATWQALVPQSITSAEYLFVNGANIIASSGNFLWTSTDNGTNWSLRYQYALSGVKTMAAIGNTIISARTALISYDNGWTWNTRSSPGLTNAVSAANNVFYSGTTAGLFMSTDNSSSWVPTGNGLGNGSIIALLKDGNDMYASLSGGGVGIYKSTDTGNNWFESSNGLAAASTVRSLLTKGNLVFAGMQGDGIYKTSNNGANWFKTGSQTDSLSNAIVFVMSVKNNSIVAGTNKGLYRTTNDGSNWTRITAGFPVNSTYLSIFGITVSGNNFVAAVQANNPNFSSGIYYSTNEGLSWVPSNLGFGSVFAVGSNGLGECLTVVSTVANQNGLYRSTNDGVNWVQNIYYFNNPDVERITGNGQNWMMSTLFTTFRSNNDGYDWGTSQAGNCGAIFTYTQMGNNIVFGGNCSGMFMKTSWDASWQDIGTGFPSNTDVEASCVNDTYVFAGTSDRAVWRRPLSELGLTGVNGNNNAGVPKEYKLEQNYPNPFNPNTVISYSIPKFSNVKLIIYDAMGRVISELINRKQDAGNYNINFNGTSLSSGVYFYKLTTESFTQTKKMLLVK